jgi:hypothetical protein
MSHADTHDGEQSSVLPPGAIPGVNGGYLTPWKKGQSGNPGGWSLAKYHAARRLCADHTLEACQLLVTLMRDAGEDSRVRYMAMMAVIERGIGKPRDHSGEDEALGRIDLSQLSASDQQILVDLLKRVMGMAK